MGFVLTHCDNCGEEVTTEQLQQPMQLFVVLSALMIHAAAIESIMVLPEYDNARPGWEERLAGITQSAQQEAEELQEFGGAYDGEEGEEQAD